MATWGKVYECINWENSPSTKTPVNEENLNKIDYAVNEIDNRVIELNGYQVKAEESAQNAKASEENAENYSVTSKSYAVGGTGTRKNEDSDNSKYYYEQAKKISQSLNGIIPQGTVAFANLPISGMEYGDMYNVSDEFLSDERFNDGGGIYYGPGNNVVWISGDLWDVTAGSSVTGVKGKNESTYRQGNVELSAEDVGAVAKEDMDSALSATSTNPVQNKAVYGAIDEINAKFKTLSDNLPANVRELAHKATAAPTTALDELTGAGIWYEYNKVCTGVPEELEGKTILALVKNETFSNITIQTLTRVSNGIIYVWTRRYSSTSSWGSWYKDINSNDMSKLRTMYRYPSDFGCNADDTTLTLEKMYNSMSDRSEVTFWINDSGSYTSIYNQVLEGLIEAGYTVGVIHGLVTIRKTAKTATVRWEFYYETTEVYERRYTTENSPRWGKWEKVATGTDLSKKVGIAAQYTTITPTGSINDVLDIDKSDPYADKNQPKKVYQMSTDTTAIANMPDAYPVGKGFVGMRFVHYFSSTNILVELVAFPSGIRWYNNYVTNAWKGWTCEPTNANNDTISAVRDDLEEIGTYTSTSYAEVGYNDNIVVGATICMQKLSKTRCNLYISYKIWTNNETDSNIFYFMSGEKIRNALGVSQLNAVASQSQVTFTPSFDVDSNGNLTVVSAETALGVMGHTGIKATIDATGLQMGRIYNDTGSYGSWPVGTYSDSLFKVNTYGQINFYGASYSI